MQGINSFSLIIFKFMKQKIHFFDYPSKQIYSEVGLVLFCLLTFVHLSFSVIFFGLLCSLEMIQKLLFLFLYIHIRNKKDRIKRGCHEEHNL